MAATPRAFVVSVTPFAPDGALDEGALRAHLRRLAAAGVGVYLGGSGSGEGHTLRHDELRRVLEIGREELAGRVAVRAMGVEPHTADEMIALGRIAAEAGVDALQVYSLDLGHGNRPRPDELRRYLRTVLDAVELPVVLSSHQAAGYALPPDLVDELLAHHHGIIGVNCSHNDLTRLVALLDAIGGRAEVHVGGPMHAMTCLALGGHGFLSSEANVVPRTCASVVDAFARGDVAAATGAFARVARLHAGFRRLGGVVAVKAALSLLGLPGGAVRDPRLPLGERETADVAALLAELAVTDAEGIASGVDDGGPTARG